MPTSQEELKRQRQEQLFQQLHVECQRLAEELENLKQTMVKCEASRRAEKGEGLGELSETEEFEGASEEAA
ncbi:MAG: hypothetical protein L0219_19920 [Phycisphaerales bacterium]|nr:hypothetical protein [Phycisphaerales bacterium]MCI0675218.1 hypothetical protein [Phycisphaerales bacterium]